MLSTTNQDPTHTASGADGPDMHGGMIPCCQAITEHAPIPILIAYGPQHRIACSSPAFAALLGELPSAIKGRLLADVLALMGADHMVSHCVQVYGTGQSTTVRNAGRRDPWSRDATWDMTIWPILDETAAPWGLFLHVDDATVQQNAIQLAQETCAMNEHLVIAGIREQELVEQLQIQLAFISAITRSLGDGVYAFDRAGLVTYVNPTAEIMLGYAESELLGIAASAILQEQSLRTGSGAHQPDPFLAVIHAGNPYRNDQAYARHRTGRILPISYTITPIRDDDQILGAVVVFRDLSAIRHLEATREEYLALLSHDLRSPLTAILGYGQQVLRTLENAGQEKNAKKVRVIVESSLRMERMLKQVLEHSTMGADPTALDWALLDLVRLVRLMIEQLPPPARERIIMERVSHLPLVGDARRLERVVVNLLTNALKYSPGTSPIVVRVFGHAEHAFVQIVDQGMGINPADLPHLFEKRYRGEGVGAIEGFGIGLYTSQLIIVAHGGQIDVESAIGGGSTFTIRIPRYIADDPPIIHGQPEPQSA